MQSRSIVNRIILLCVVLLLFQGMVFAATFYVSTTGNNSNPGTSTGSPKRTIMGAGGGLSLLTPGAGDRLEIRAGTYSENLDTNSQAFPSGTTYANAATIAAFAGETVTIRSINLAGTLHHIIFERLVVDGGLSTGLNALAVMGGSTHHIRFLNMEIKNSTHGDLFQINTNSHDNEVIGGSLHGGRNADFPPSGGYGMYILGQDNVIDGVDIYDCSGYGIHNYDEVAPLPNRNIYRNNKIHNMIGGGGVTVGNGILLGSGNGMIAYNNFIYGNSGDGIQVSNGATDVKVYNNSVYGNNSTNNGYGGIVFGNDQRSIVKNNISYGNTGGNFADSTGAGDTPNFSNNLCNSLTMGCSFTGDPLFTSATDLHIRSGSAAIDHGTLLSDFSVDLDGNSRPQGAVWDIGADERILSAPTVSMTAPANGATVSGATVTISANATPAAGTTISGVQFVLDGANLQAEDTSAPYSIVWNSASIANGSHTLRAVARDSNNSTAPSSIIGITVNNASSPPVISGVSAQGITSTGATIVWTTSSASDTQVEYGTSTSYGSSTTLNTSLVTSHSQALSGLSTGTLYHYRVKSKDAAAQLTTSGDFTFTTLDSTAPSVSMTAPANAATVSGATVTVSASASDNVGVVGVTFKRDGGTVIAAEDTTAPYSIVWDSRTVSNSSHTLTATARDAAGNTTTSASISVTVDNGAQIRFVTKSGSDSNSCDDAKTIGTAKLTIAAGIACTSPGDTLKIGDGTYAESISLSGNTLTGTAVARTTIQANTINGTTPGVILAPATPTASGDAVTITDTSYISFKGIRFNAAVATQNGIRLTGSSSNVLIEDSHVHAAQAAIFGINVASNTSVSNIIRRCKVYEIGTNGAHVGIELQSSNNLVEDSEVYSVGGQGIESIPFTAGFQAHSNIIRRNKLHDSNIAYGGITVGGNEANASVGNQVYNNIVDSTGFGIELFNIGSGNKVWNNTVYNNSEAGISVDAGQTSIEVINNIVFQNGTGIQNSGTGTIQSNVVVDPLFTDGPGGDLTLTSGSPARDMGQTIGAFSTDYLQIVRPVGSAWDVGAYEFVSGPDTTPPTVSISAPVGGATVNGTSVTVSANAADNVGVSGVQFKLDGSNLGSEDTSAPFSITWDSTSASNASHSLTAVARDAVANTATSAIVTVTVDNAAPPDTTNPTVSVTAPAPGSTVSGTTVIVSANASDNVGVVGVQFKVDNVNSGSEDTTAPYSILYNSTLSSNGTHSITAVARDAATNTTTSTPVTITVNNAVPDTNPPTVSVTAPSAGTVQGTITVSANASDDVGVVGVIFRVDGVQIDGEDLSAPYSISWNSASVSDGSHTITARARDAAGNVTTSSGIAITVSNSAPVISGVSAGSITTTAATISWTTSTSADSRVDYGFTTTYTDYVTLGTFSTSHSIPLTGLSPFTQYHYQVSSRDSLGRLAQSGDFTFTTASAAPATITVTEPTSSDVWSINATVPINWTSANVTGNVRILISRNSGSTWKVLYSSVPVVAGTKNWTGVTNPTTAGAKIRVESVTNATIRDDSDAFRIQK